MPPRASLPKICIALGFPTVEKLLEHARREVDAGETFLEFRLDFLDSPSAGVDAIRRFLADHPECTILATCRRHQNHGKYNGSIEEQVRILDQAIDAGARVVDIEIESAENARGRLEHLRAKCFLIVSYHNYDGTPAMEAVLRRLTAISADGYKMVATARKPSDNQRVLSLARSHPRVPMVLLAMGETGFPSRVLSTSLGGLYTYAAPTAADGTAAGQVSSKMLRHLFRVDKFSSSAKVYGVIADPVRHSISPVVHNRAFQARRVDAVYLPFLVHPPQLKDFLVFAEKQPVAGFSVTIPHKQKIMRYLDVVDSLARRIGAVNTVWRKAGKWRGTNTDAQGVTKPLSKHVRLPKVTVLIVGNGGAARGAAFALADAGAKVSIVGRNPDRVRALAKVCDGEAVMKELFEGRRAATPHYDVVVHATPLGMSPNANDCFFSGDIPGELVMDMVYNPLETELLKRAAAQGKKTIAGLDMFLEQAAAQYEIWTGETAPRAVMQKAAMEALSNHTTATMTK